MKRLLAFLVVLVLLSGLTHANAASVPETEAAGCMREAAFLLGELYSSPAAPVHAADLSAVLSRLSGGAVEASDSDASLRRDELCRLLWAFLEALDWPADLPQTTPYFPDTSKETTPYTRYITDLAALGIVSADSDGLFRPAEAVTAGEAALALGRALRFTQTGHRRLGTPSSDLPQGERADLSVLDNSCLIGHSHGVGMKMNLDLPNVDFFAINGMTAVDILGQYDFSLPDGFYGSLAQGLTRKTYEKVYILLGTNDMPGGAGNLPRFTESMDRVIQLVRSTQPGAQVYLLSLGPVEEAYKSFTPWFTNDFILWYNGSLKDLSRRYGLHYLDIYTPLTDMRGYMRGRYARGDTLHFNYEGYSVFLDTMLTHYERTETP